MDIIFQEGVVIAVDHQLTPEQNQLKMLREFFKIPDLAETDYLYTPTTPTGILGTTLNITGSEQSRFFYSGVDNLQKVIVNRVTASNYLNAITGGTYDLHDIATITNDNLISRIEARYGIKFQGKKANANINSKDSQKIVISFNFNNAPVSETVTGTATVTFTDSDSPLISLNKAITHGTVIGDFVLTGR